MDNRDALPGVVVLIDQDRRDAICTATVVKNEPAGDAFVAYVLTARHCVVGEGRPHRLGITTPHVGTRVAFVDTEVLDATLAYVPPHGEPDHWFESPWRGPVDWLANDWAILRVETSKPLPSIPVFEGDPARVIEPGEPVTLPTYFDYSFNDLYGASLRPHEHPFGWTGVPRGIFQGGHSGAPVLWRGQVVGVFSGYGSNSYAARLVTGQTWPMRLRMVSIATIRGEAAKMGIFLVR